MILLYCFPRMTPRRLLLAGLFIWCAAIVATPLLSSLGGAEAGAASVSYEFFSRVCHQLDSRSFHIAGNKFAVCIRCTSIYTAFFLSVLLSPVLLRTFLSAVSPRVLLIVSALPMAVDVGLAAIGAHDSTAATRLVTGAVFGCALGIILAPLLEELAAEFLSRLKKLLQTTYATKTR
jgi:uncharacterized membrane protein